METAIPPFPNLCSPQPTCEQGNGGITPLHILRAGCIPTKQLWASSH